MIDGFVENVIIRYALSRPRLFLSFHPLPPLPAPGTLPVCTSVYYFVGFPRSHWAACLILRKARRPQPLETCGLINEINNGASKAWRAPWRDLPVPCCWQGGKMGEENHRGKKTTQQAIAGPERGEMYVI